MSARQPKPWTEIGGSRVIEDWRDNPELDRLQLHLEPATIAHGPRLNALFNEVFQRSRSIEEWRWKNLEHPNANLSWNHLAVTPDDRVVAQYGNLPLILRLNGEVHLGAQQADNLVHSDYRQGGVVHRVLMRTTVLRGPTQHVYCSLGFPNREAYLVGKRLMRYQDLCKIQRLRQRISLARAARERIRPNRGTLPAVKMLSASSRLAASIGASLSPAVRGAGIRIEVLSEAPSQMDELWNRTRPQIAMAEHRCSRWLHWRYFSSPRTDYRVLGAWRAEELLGIAVVRPPESFSSGVASCYLMDLVAVDGAEAPLLHEVRKLAARLGGDELIAWDSPGNPYRDAMLGHGYQAFGDPLRVVYWLHAKYPLDPEDFGKASNWYLTAGTGDDL